MNPRYLAYCRAHGMDPKDMKRIDKERFPGGSMAGYQLWISGKYGEFRTMTHNKKRNFSAEDYKAFDKWLATEQGGES